MNYRILIFSAITAAVLVCCNGNQGKNTSPITPKIDKFALLKSSNAQTKMIINANNMSDLFTLNKFIDLETKPECLIGTIEDIILIPDKQKIVILNKVNVFELLLFDFNGKFIKRIGNQGEGPGEYFNPHPILYYNNKLAVYSQNRRLLFYDLDGKLLDEISFSVSNWHFTVDRMASLNNDIYIYTNNSYYNYMNVNKRSRVFRLKNGNILDKSYGNIEDTYDWNGGDITKFNKSIIFSGVFDGNLYQIFPSIEDLNNFVSLGKLYDTDNIKNSSDPFSFLLHNIDNIDAAIQLAPINSYLFLKTLKNIFIIDSVGTILNNNLKDDIFPTKEFSDNALRLQYVFYNDGLIQAFNKKIITTSELTPNPSLLIYQFKYSYYSRNQAQ